MNQSTMLQYYLHLNSSFSDNIGLLEGKLGSVLYFSCFEDSYYREEITFNFLEEIISQINEQTTFSFGNGIAGLGCLLEYLNNNQILDVDVNELLEDFEPKLLKFIEAELYPDTSLGYGLSGYGLYMLSRYNSGALSTKKKETIRASLATIIDKILDDYSAAPSKFEDTSLWTGVAGTYLFLSHSLAAGVITIKPEKRVNNLIYNVLNTLSIVQPSWQQIPLWFALLNCQSLLPGSGYAGHIRSLFLAFLNWCSGASVTIHFTDAAFFAALLHYTSIFQNITECQSVSEKLMKNVNRLLASNSLNLLFPYDPDKRNINTGLLQGVSGTALALQSIENNDFRWMGILGYRN